VRYLDSHTNSDDHTDCINNIIGVPKVDVFVSVSQDMTMKVWNAQNILLRDIVFYNPLETVCLCNSKGDILFGIKDRVDIIKYYQCKNLIF
jgi:hypothetical protein